MSEPNAKNTSDLLDGAEPENKDADDQTVVTDDDQKPDDDAAAAADDSGADDQGDDGKDDDKVAEDEAAIAAQVKQQKDFDDRHALMLARTTPANPAVAARVSKETATSPRVEADPSSSTELGEDGDDTPVGDLTVAQFNKLVEDKVEKGINEGLGRARKADGVLQERADMTMELLSLADDYNLTKEEADEALAEGNLIVPEDDKHIPGGPSRFARVVGKEMRMIAARKARPLNDRKAAADAEDKVRKQLAGQQPGKIGAPPGKVLSEKDERLRKMNSFGGKNATSLIDK